MLVVVANTSNCILQYFRNSKLHRCMFFVFFFFFKPNSTPDTIVCKQLTNHTPGLGASLVNQTTRWVRGLVYETRLGANCCGTDAPTSWLVDVTQWDGYR